MALNDDVLRRMGVEITIDSILQKDMQNPSNFPN